MDSDLTLKGHSYIYERAFSGYVDDVEAHRIRATNELGGDRLVLLFDDETRNLDEAARAASALESRDSIFARYIDHGLEETDGDDPWLVWVEDWVRGYRLKDILRSRTTRFGFTEYRQLILDLAGCLAAPRQKHRARRNLGREPNSLRTRARRPEPDHAVHGREPVPLSIRVPQRSPSWTTTTASWRSCGAVTTSSSGAPIYRLAPASTSLQSSRSSSAPRKTSNTGAPLDPQSLKLVANPPTVLSSRTQRPPIRRWRTRSRLMCTGALLERPTHLPSLRAIEPMG